MNDQMKRGTLALVGSGEYLPGMEPVDRFLLDRLGAAPQVACLPTAAGTEGEETVARWMRMGVEHFSRLGTRVDSVKVIDRKTADDDSNADRIRAANFVYLSGGDPGYLHKTLKGTKSWEAITSVLANGGVVAGCSAGAMIWGEKIPSFPTILPLRTVFNQLSGTLIMPHFDEFGERWGPMVRPLIGNLTMLGIDGYTALVSSDSLHTVAGAGGVTVWNRKRKTRYANGEVVTWP